MISELFTKKKILKLLKKIPDVIIGFVIAQKINLEFSWEKIKGRKIVIFEINYSGHIQYVEPVIKELSHQSPELLIYIAYGNIEVINDISHLPVSRTRLFPSWASKFLIFQDAFISPTQWSRCPVMGIKICMFHGQPSKNTTFIPKLIKKFNYLFFISPLQRDFFKMQVSEKNDVSKRIITFDIGYPKSDDFFTGKYKRNSILQSLGLNQDKITVIYAPSYEEGTSLREFGEDIITTLAGMDINLLVKLHPASLSPEGDIEGTQGINWVERLKKFDSFPNYRFLNTKVIDPYLVASDIMVTDVSGVALEFMNLNRPIIYFDSPKFYDNFLVKIIGNEAKNARENVFCNAGRNAGLGIQFPEDLPRAVRRSIDNPQEFSKQREEIIKNLTFNKGHSSEIFVKKLLNLINH
jgi:hypothetical protein